MSIEIAEAQPRDLEAMMRIYNEAVLDGGSTADLTPRTLEEQQRWVDAHAPLSRYPVVVARRAGPVRNMAAGADMDRPGGGGAGPDGLNLGDGSASINASDAVGFGSLSKFHPRAGYDGVVELSYYVASGARHHGVGTTLVDWLLAAARERQYRMAVTLIFASNTGSIALMKHFGFTRFGLLPGACDDGTQLLDLSYWYLNL